MSLSQTAALAALQGALAALFAGDAELMAAVGGRIHDGPPRGPVQPYLAFAEARTREVPGGGVRVALGLEAVTTDDGRTRALSVLGRAVDLALAGPVILAGGVVVLLRADGTGIARLKDGRGWRAGATLDALIDG